jgi:hypothetical protein
LLLTALSLEDLTMEGGGSANNGLGFDFSSDDFFRILVGTWAPENN